MRFSLHLPQRYAGQSHFPTVRRDVFGLGSRPQVGRGLKGLEGIVYAACAQPDTPDSIAAGPTDIAAGQGLGEEQVRAGSRYPAPTILPTATSPACTGRVGACCRMTFGRKLTTTYGVFRALICHMLCRRAADSPLRNRLVGGGRRPPRVRSGWRSPAHLPSFRPGPRSHVWARRDIRACWFLGVAFQGVLAVFGRIGYGPELSFHGS